MGHTDAALALNFYAKVMRRGGGREGQAGGAVEGGGDPPTGEPALSPSA